MGSVLAGFTTIVVVIAAGWLMARLGILKGSDQRVLADLSFHLGLPPLMFLLLWRANVGEVFSTHLGASIGAMVVVSALYLASEVLVWRKGLGDAVVGVYASFYVNAANIGIPIATYVLGDPTWAVPILVVQTAFFQPIALAIFDVRRARSTGQSMGWVRKVLLPIRNPITIGALLGLAANLVHLRLPAAVVSPLEVLAQLAVPTMLVAFGISLRASGLPGRSPHLPQVVWIAVLKLLVMPAAAWALARWAFALDAHTSDAVAVCAGLPTAQNVFLNSLRYDESVPLARDAVFVTTVCSFGTLLALVLLGHA